MNPITTRRDYHLTRFKIEKYLEKGFDKLNNTEEQELRDLSKEMSKYEKVHFPMPGKSNPTPEVKDIGDML